MSLSQSHGLPDNGKELLSCAKMLGSAQNADAVVFGGGESPGAEASDPVGGMIVLHGRPREGKLGMSRRFFDQFCGPGWKLVKESPGLCVVLNADGAVCGQVVGTHSLSAPVAAGPVNPEKPAAGEPSTTGVGA
jgi:hypothetical protein